MTCICCKGKMKKGTAPFHIDREGYHISWDAIPAWVCSQCGEAYFEESEVDRIQHILSRLEKDRLSNRKNSTEKIA